ncbi:hypothetical protein CHS0354_017897 [Potamilus streckersoni]|uniref:Novel STAND NTPase 3 domain-containing protein n=1 Tax=Potamilus streckersoni TaxID=2493646 RepID=A0AAE0T2U3_9BIVA|nr:hypothetical protein CHS0354_017897 [Potamilus streckersoni]
MDDTFMTTVTTGHNIYPSTTAMIRRTVSADSVLLTNMDSISLKDKKSNAVQEVLLSLDMMKGSNTNSFTESMRTSINSVALSHCSSVFVGCLVNTSSTRKEDVCINADNIYQNAPEDMEPSYTNEYSQNPFLQNVIDNTNLVLENWKMRLFVRSPAYELSLQTLNRYGVVFITGNLGDGKTMTSRKLMKDMRKTDTILLELNARNPASFETLVNGTRNSVVFIDDFLGNVYMDGNLLEMWTRRFPLMEDMIGANNVQFILTTRKDIMEEAKSSLKIHEFFQIRKKIITANQLKEIAKIETPIGYPLCCYLFTRYKRFADEGTLFFQNPIHYIKWEIQRLEREDTYKYCVLAVLLLCGGKILHSDIILDHSSKTFRSALSKVSKTCEIRLERAKIAMVSNILASSGTFLKMTNDGGFIFSHNSIEKAVALAYRTKGLKDIIQMCPFGFLLEIVVTNSNDQPAIVNNPDRLETISTIELSVIEFDLLVNRFVSEILDGNVREVSDHMALLDSGFLDRFFEIIRQSGKITEVITARQNVNDGGDLLFHASHNKIPKVDLLERLLKVHSENQPRKYNCARLNCFLARKGYNDYLEDVMSSALHTACKLGLKEMFDILLQFNAKETPNLLSTAIESQSFEILQRLLQKYKWSDKQKQLGLLESCKHGNIKIFELMVQSVKTKLGEGIFSRCLLESTKSGNVDLFEMILAKGCDVNYRGDLERCALHIACIGAHESLVIRLLRVPKININAIDKQGYTALHYAAENNLVSIVKHLINAKADIKFSARIDGITVTSSLPGMKSRLTQMVSPYDLAMLRGHIEVCMVLEDVAFPGSRIMGPISTRL